MTYIGTSYNTMRLMNIKIRGLKIAVYWIVMPRDDSNLQTFMGYLCKFLQDYTHHFPDDI